MNNLNESYIIYDVDNKNIGKVYYTIKNKIYYADIYFNKLMPKIKKEKKEIINGFTFIEIVENENEKVSINGKEFEIKELNEKLTLQADSYNELKKLTIERINEFGFNIGK